MLIQISHFFWRHLGEILLLGSLSTIVFAIFYRKRVRFYKMLIFLALVIPILVIAYTPIFHGDYRERSCEAERKILTERGRLDQVSPMCLPEQERPVQCPICK